MLPSDVLGTGAETGARAPPGERTRACRQSNACHPATSTRHTTQEHPFEVVIHYPHHPRAGECVVAFRRVVHGGLIHFVIEQTNGCRVLVPAWMTEGGAAALPMVEAPRLSLASLRELRGIVDAQLVSSSPSSKTTRTAGGDDEATAPTMATTRSVGVRSKRKPAAARSDRSRGGHKSAQAAAQRTVHRPPQSEGGGR